MVKPRPCAHCGVIFLPEFPRSAARMCSPECLKARRQVQQLASTKRYYERNKDERREHAKKYARENRDVMSARWNDWARRNRERRNARQRELYAAKKAERST